ncbi:alpha/beta hydrolase family protein [Tuwongella immobilis]|uniref:AB hydrolase-1 domain-containing protein n=1 Tax=Tuwongella immobilis TaxID=692036 RepID=A0A6C2YHA4_9BACT|nr:alpha/beta fold hydrolase [Tuwongella immobilis]VIP00908.1 Uncharacterized protein OS=Planctomyces maris DSM 8797 GN=PM8797T_16478 PE=4 SV=1: Abhydrolase_5 [Tuwongella immobilis]VTR97234.1 Uncharacterized protein OS=Planctomyces maris DSM 8797 GN=PM8797T_16478 PE=4 SV=1: Abhydrolase_5 [Tuwongella immobilis]
MLGKPTWILSIVLTGVLLPAISITLHAAPPELEDVAFQSTHDRTEQRYIRIQPADRRKPVDLLIALHGHGSDRWQFAKDPRDECRAARDIASRYGMLYISPDYRARTSWMGPAAEADLLQIIAESKSQFRIRHVYLCGGSMGGTSALSFAAMHPQAVTGVVSMNGLANHFEFDRFQDAIQASFGGTKERIPEEYKKRSAEYWPERLTMPIACTTGGKDDIVPPGSVSRLMAVLKTLNRPVMHRHREQGGHSTTYDDAIEAFEFVIQKSRTTRQPSE